MNNHAHVLRARDGEVDARYLTHYLNQVDYRGLANGTTRLKLPQAALRRIAVRAPAIEEQRRIVDILETHLSHLDAGCTGLERVKRRVAAWCNASIDRTIWASGAPLARLDSLLAEPMRNGHSARSSKDGTGIPTLTLTAVTDADFSGRIGQSS